MLTESEYPEELKLLIKILSLEFNSAKSFTLPQVIDEEAFLFWLKRHKVLGMTYPLIKKFDLSFSSKFLQELKTYQESNSLRAMKHVRELVFLKDKFDCSSSRFAPVKGVIISKKLYGDLGRRYAGDIDLLIDLDDFEKADQIMINNGYSRLEFDGFEHERMKVHLSLSHEMTYYNATKDITVELTRSMNSQFYDPSLMRNGKLTKFEIAKSQFSVLKNENELVELCLHGCGHLWERLQWLCDIAIYMSKNELDWDEVYEISRHKDVEELLFGTLSLCKQFFDLKIPDQFQSILLSQKAIKLHSYSIDYIASKEHKAESLSLRIKRTMFILNLPKKPNYYQCFKKLLYNVDDWKRIDFPPRLYFMYFLFRPFLFAKGN